MAVQVRSPNTPLTSKKVLNA